MSRYILAAEAQQDLREIRDYLTTGAGPRVARYILSSFIIGFRRIAKRPGMGHRREDLSQHENLRFWPIGTILSPSPWLRCFMAHGMLPKSWQSVRYEVSRARREDRTAGFSARPLVD